MFVARLVGACRRRARLARPVLRNITDGSLVRWLFVCRTKRVSSCPERMSLGCLQAATGEGARICLVVHGRRRTCPHVSQALEKADVGRVGEFTGLCLTRLELTVPGQCRVQHPWRWPTIDLSSSSEVLVEFRRGRFLSSPRWNSCAPLPQNSNFPALDEVK